MEEIFFISYVNNVEYKINRSDLIYIPYTPKYHVDLIVSWKERIAAMNVQNLHTSGYYSVTSLPACSTGSCLIDSRMQLVVRVLYGQQGAKNQGFKNVLGIKRRLNGLTKTTKIIKITGFSLQNSIFKFCEMENSFVQYIFSFT